MLGVTACIRKWMGIFWDLWACVRLEQELIDSMIYLYHLLCVVFKLRGYLWECMINDGVTVWGCGSLAMGCRGSGSGGSMGLRGGGDGAGEVRALTSSVDE